jgi:hypothetical protein
MELENLFTTEKRQEADEPTQEKRKLPLRRTLVACRFGSGEPAANAQALVPLMKV